jgi:Polyketide cyclase / dehydrase and lipid transport
MTVNRRVMRGLTPKAVFDVLRDGRSYQEWVVGTRAIREVEPGWPEPGTALHYTIGYGLLRKDDETRSRKYDPDHRLELEAHAWPAGTVRIDLRAEPVEDGTLVTIDEHPLHGPARTVHNPALDALIWIRNVETLRRLESVTRRRVHGTFG